MRAIKKEEETDEDDVECIGVLPSSNDLTAADAREQSSAASASAPVPAKTKFGVSPSDPTLLIKLTPEQSNKMKFPVGCPVWFNILLNASSLSSRARDMKKYSSLGDVNIGLVKSISMDITTRNLMYEVSPAKIVGGVFKSETGNIIEGGQKGLFLEDHLCYASKCLVRVQLDETMDGEVITCCFSNGWAAEKTKKTYMVSVFLNDDQVRIFQSVSEDDIKYRPVEDSVLEDTIDHQEANQIKLKDNVESELGDSEYKEAGEKPIAPTQSAALEPERTELKDTINHKDSKQNKPKDNAESEHGDRENTEPGEIEPKDLMELAEEPLKSTQLAAPEPERTELEVAGAILQNSQDIEKTLKPTQSAAPQLEHSYQTEDVTSSNIDIGFNSPNSTAVSAVNPANNASVASSNNLLHSKPCIPSSSSRGYHLDSRCGSLSSLSTEKNSSADAPSAAQSNRWVPPTQTTSLNSNDSSRKRPNSVERREDSRQRPSKCMKKSDNGVTIQYTSGQKRKEKIDLLRLLGTLSAHGNRSSPSPGREVQLTPVSNESSRNEVIQALNDSISGSVEERANKSQTPFFLKRTQTDREDGRLKGGQPDDPHMSRSSKKRAKAGASGRAQADKPIPRKPLPSRTKKSCKLCAEYGGFPKTHITAQCKKYIAGGKNHPQWSSKTANINVHQAGDVNQLMAQQAEFQKKIMKQMSKFSEKKKSSKRLCDSYSDSNSSDSD